MVNYTKIIFLKKRLRNNNKATSSISESSIGDNGGTSSVGLKSSSVVTRRNQVKQVFATPPHIE